jgi:hypothetical protein
MSKLKISLTLSTALVAVVGFSAHAHPGLLDSWVDLNSSVHGSVQFDNKEMLANSLSLYDSVRPIDLNPKAIDNKLDIKENDQTLYPQVIETVTKELQQTQQVAPARFEPLVIEKNGKPQVTNTFADMAMVNLLANHLSYCLVKGNVELAEEPMDKLLAMGWEKVGMFSALEGKYLNFSTTAGMVLYHKEKNMYTVVWHGTASNGAGWESNVDAELIETAGTSLSRNVVSSLNLELHAVLDAEIAANKGNKDLIGTLNYLKSLVNSTEKNAAQLRALFDIFRNGLPDIADNAYDRNQKSDKDKANALKNVSLKEKIESVFAVKLETLDMVERNQSGMNFEGKTHRGFTLKVASGQEELDQILSRHAQSLNEHQRKSARVVLTGHSMAGALAKISAVALMNRFENIFGQKLDNNKEHRILVHALSAAAVGDENFKNYVEGTLGKANIFDQKCDKDNVPKAFLTNGLHAFLESIPIVGKELASLTGKYKGYAKQIGYAAVDTYADVKARAEALYPSKGFVSGAKELGQHLVSDVANNLSPAQYKADVQAELDAVAKEKGRVSKWDKVKAHGKKLLKRGALIVASPVIAAAKVIAPMVVRNKVEVPHYGVNMEDAHKQPKGQEYGRDAHFEPSLASPVDGVDGYNRMLTNGVEAAE